MISTFHQRNIQVIAQIEATAESENGIDWYCTVVENINGVVHDRDEGPMGLEECLERIGVIAHNHMEAIEAAIEEMRNTV